MPTDYSAKIRTATPEDLARLHEMFSRLSPTSIYQRFHMPLHEVPDRMALHMVGKGDSGGRYLVAVSEDRVVGHAMHSLPERDEAEVGVIVEDRWHSRGVGRMLLQRLAQEARSDGVETFTCFSLWENRCVDGLIKGLCPAAVFEVKDGIRITHVPLGAPDMDRGIAPDYIRERAGV